MWVVGVRIDGTMEKTDASIERLVELLGAYFSTVLTASVLEETTGGELTPSQLEAMAFIQRHGGCSAKELSEGLRISIPSATRQVDRLVRKLLVTRHESGSDRRLVELHVTPIGEAALAAVRAARVGIMQRALETLPPSEREALRVLLDRFLQAALHDEAAVNACCRRCGTDHDCACVVNEAHLALIGRPVEHP